MYGYGRRQGRACDEQPSPKAMLRFDVSSLGTWNVYTKDYKEHVRGCTCTHQVARPGPAQIREARRCTRAKGSPRRGSHGAGGGAPRRDHALLPAASALRPPPAAAAAALASSLSHGRCVGGDGSGATEVRHQLRADREQPAAPGAGVGPSAVAEREPREALRRRPGGADGVRRHGRGVHRRQRGPRQPDGRAQGPRVGGAARAAVPPGHAHHLHHRGQRGALRRRHGRHAEPPPGDAGRVPGGGGAGPRRPGERLHGALRQRARQQLPAVVGRVPGGARGVHPPHPRLPRRGRLAVPRQRLPVLRLQGQPRHHLAAVRAVRAQPRRGGPQHQPHLRQHALRPDRRRVRRHEGHGAHGPHCQDLRDRVAVQGRRRRGGRHRRQRRRLQRQPHEEDRHGPGHAAQAARARRRLRLRALQRGHEARPDVGEELRLVLPQRHGRVQPRLQRSVVQPIAHDVLLFFQAGDYISDGGCCPTRRRLLPMTILYTVPCVKIKLLLFFLLTPYVPSLDIRLATRAHISLT